MNKQKANKNRILISICLAFALMLAPVQVAACPHFSADEDLFWPFFNEDYTVATKVFPRQDHLLNRDVVVEDLDAFFQAMTDDFFDVFDEPEDTEPEIILSEMFSFPLVQSLETHVTLYTLVNEAIATDGWGLGVETLGLQTTVEGLEQVLVHGTGINLLVDLPNTFEASRAHVNDDVYEMHYNVRITKLNDEQNHSAPDSLYYAMMERIRQANLELIRPEILQVSAHFRTMSHDWQFEKIELNALYDSMEVQLETMLDECFYDVVAINLARSFYADEAIPAAFDLGWSFLYPDWEWVGNYAFSVDEPGVFVLVNADFDVELFNSVFAAPLEEMNIHEDSEPRSTGGFSLLLVFLSLAAGAGIAAIGFVLHKKKAAKKQ